MSLNAVRGRSKEISPIAAHLAQVNLLPPEIAASRAISKLKFALLVAVLISFGVVLLLFFWATSQVDDAQTNLDSETSRTAALQSELATYSEVTAVKADLADISFSAWLSTATEIEWFSYLEAINAVTPVGVSYDSLVVTTTTPVSRPNPPYDPLHTEAFATVDFVGRVTSTSQVTELVTALEGIPGVTRVSYSVQRLTGDEEWAGEYFEFGATIHISEEPVTNRLAEVIGGDE